MTKEDFKTLLGSDLRSTETTAQAVLKVSLTVVFALAFVCVFLGIPLWFSGACQAAPTSASPAFAKCLPKSQVTAVDLKYLIERTGQNQPVIEMPTGIDVEIGFLDGVYVRGVN